LNRTEFPFQLAMRALFPTIAARFLHLFNIFANAPFDPVPAIQTSGVIRFGYHG